MMVWKVCLDHPHRVLSYHGSEAAAQRAAKRLARVSPGDAYLVLSCPNLWSIATEHGDTVAEGLSRLQARGLARYYAREARRPRFAVPLYGRPVRFAFPSYEVRVPGQTAWQDGFARLSSARRSLKDARSVGLLDARIYRVSPDGERTEV